MAGHGDREVRVLPERTPRRVVAGYEKRGPLSVEQQILLVRDDLVPAARAVLLRETL
jgi:hypothetical protein